MNWSIGGERLSKAERNEILRVFTEQSLEDATRLAVNWGLSHEYAYKLAHERGLIPRASKYWGKNREIA